MSYVYYKVAAFCFSRLFFYSESSYACIASFDFFNEEYLIALVDFIVALRRTKGQRRWTLRESLSSILWTLTPHPGESLRRVD